MFTVVPKKVRNEIYEHTDLTKMNHLVSFLSYIIFTIRIMLILFHAFGEQNKTITREKHAESRRRSENRTRRYRGNETNTERGIK